MLQTTDYKDRVCDCETCVSMCTRFPCRPLPDEVVAMPPEVRARLMENHLYGADGNVYHLQAGGRDREGGEFPESAYGFFGIGRENIRCTFLTDDGKCELHGKCKPFEGRKSDCNREYPDGHKETAHPDRMFPDRMAELIFEAWNTDEGRAVMASWREEVGR